MLNRTVPAESDFFHANADRVAVPLTGPGGKMAVFETKKTGRIPDGVMPESVNQIPATDDIPKLIMNAPPQVLINSCNVMDFGFDPFDSRRLAVACDDGRVRVWSIPEEGLVHQGQDSHFPTPSFVPVLAKCSLCAL